MATDPQYPQSDPYVSQTGGPMVAGSSFDSGTPQRLTRDTERGMIGGVCAGLSRRFGWDVNLIRVLFVLSCVLPGPQVLAYLAMWIIIPSDR